MNISLNPRINACLEVLVRGPAQVYDLRVQSRQPFFEAPRHPSVCSGGVGLGHGSSKYNGLTINSAQN